MGCLNEIGKGGKLKDHFKKDYTYFFLPLEKMSVFALTKSIVYVIQATSAICI